MACVMRAPRTKQHCENLSKALKGRRIGAALGISEEARKRKSEKMKVQHKLYPDKFKNNDPVVNEKKRQSHLKALAAGKYKKKKESCLEIRIEEMFKELGFLVNKDYFKQVRLPKKKPRYVVDFYFPKLSLVVEAYGCWWHRCPHCSNGEGRPQDRDRIDVLIDSGYDLWRIWGHQIFMFKTSVPEQMVTKESMRRLLKSP